MIAASALRSGRFDRVFDPTLYLKKIRRTQVLMKFVERVCSARSASPARGTDSGHFQNAGRLDLAGV